MEVRFFGTRGSIAVPGPQTVKYGGNTSCVSVRSADTLVVLDMGTGAYALGQELVAAGKPVKGHVLITHTHWDHIQGLPFFLPFFRPGNEWDIYAPRGLRGSIRETLSGQMQYTYFPLELEQLGATIRYHDLVEGTLTLGDISVEAQYLNHPALTLGYRLAADGVAVVYALDHEPFSPALAEGAGLIEGPDLRHAEFLKGADLVIHDGQFLASEYGPKIGWGHSTVEYALHVARAAGVKRLALAHHDPNRGDGALDALVARFKPKAKGLELFAAAEGMKLTLAREERLTAAPAVRRHPEAGTATAEPTLERQFVVLAGGLGILKERLANILRNDNVAAATCDLESLAEAVERHAPTLIMIADAPNVGALLAAVRSARAQYRDVPVILASGSDPHESNEELGITDRLVEPFTDNYARTRIRAWLMRQACRWTLPPLPANETERLAALHALDILDTPPHRLLDSLVGLASELFDVPIVAVTLVDRDRQWFKASCGLSQPETPRDVSFCAHVVANPVATVIPDTLQDMRFADHPQVVGLPRLRFYAAHPIILKHGPCIGTLCIADMRPRQLSEAAMRRLARLAGLVLDTIELESPSPPR